MNETTRIIVPIPTNAQLGDIFPIKGTARIVAIQEELVDVSTAYGQPQYIPGERTATLHLEITDA